MDLNKVQINVAAEVARFVTDTPGSTYVVVRIDNKDSAAVAELVETLEVQAYDFVVTRETIRVEYPLRYWEH